MTQERVEVPIDVDLSAFQQGMDAFRTQMQASDQLSVSLSGGLTDVTTSITQMQQAANGGLVAQITDTHAALRPISTVTNQATASLNSFASGDVISGVDQLSDSFGAVSTTASNLIFKLGTVSTSMKSVAIAANALSFVPGVFGLIAKTTTTAAEGTSRVAGGLGVIGGFASSVAAGLAIILAPLRGLVTVAKMIASAFRVMFAVVIAPFRLLFGAIMLVVRGMTILLKPVLAVAMIFFRLKIMIAAFKLQFVVLGKLLAFLPPQLRLIVGGLALLGVTGRAGAAAMRLVGVALIPLKIGFQGVKLVVGLVTLNFKSALKSALSLAIGIGSLALKVGGLAAKLTKLAFRGAIAGMKSLGRASLNAAKSIGGGLVKAMSSALKIGVGIVAAGAGWGIKLAADAEQAQVAFQTMLKSGDAAKAVLGELEQFAASTPFQLNDLRDGAKQLLNAQVPAQDLTKRLTMLGDIAAGTGKPIGDFVKIFAKVKSTGKVSLETLNQLAERGVPIYGALGSQLGKSRTEMLKMIGSGKVGFNDLDAALKATATGAGVFAGGMAAQSQTVTGLFSTLKDNVGFAMRSLGEEIISAFDFKALMTDGIALFQSLKAGIKSATPVFVAIATVVKSAFAAVWEVVSVTFSAITSALGITGGNWMESFVTWAAVASFAFKNWPTIAELAFTKVGLFLVRTAGQFTHLFTGVIPALLSWFYDNFTSIFETAGSAVGAIFTNMGRNIVNAMTAIWAFIKSGGTSSLEFAWTPLLDGFESTVKQLPNIPERAIGALEKSLEGKSKQLGSALSTGLATEIGENLKMLDDFKLKQAEAIQPPSLADINGPDAAQVDQSTTSNERSSFVVDSLNKGSAEALKAIFSSQNKTPEKQLSETKKTNTLLGGLPDKIASAFPAQPEVQGAV